MGPYEIVGPIGAGGMGEVYRARDLRLNREIALKILPEAFAQDPDRLRRFHQEAQAAGSLNHPNIVAVYDIGQSDSVTYVITELLEGETLRRRLSRSPLPLRKAIDFGIQIARGLAAAHARGITHRDVKPENLFVIRHGIKILDFGLAKMASATVVGATIAATAALETSPGVVLGSTGYMAPEQVRGGVTDHRCDLFSLGVVLYEMLSGHRPFAGASAADTMSAILREEPADLPASVPAVLGGIVRRCLEKNPDERFESARDLAFALESIASASVGQDTVKLPFFGNVAWRAAFAVLIVALPIAAWVLAKRNSRSAAPQIHQVTFRLPARLGSFSGSGRSDACRSMYSSQPGAANSGIPCTCSRDRIAAAGL